MKPAALFFIFLMTFGTIHPLVSNCRSEGKASIVKSTCGARTCCSKKDKNSKTPPPAEQNNERSEVCNPFASCSGCQFTANYKIIYAKIITPAIKVKLYTSSENIQTGFIADCWHPPEGIPA
jgi:hypothetical protein